MSSLLELKKELREIADPKRAKVSQRYFKTGKGEYGEGDVFLGITVPQSRKIAQKYKDLDFSSIEKLLKSKVHEERLIALLILVYKFSHFAKPDLASRDKQKQIFDFYLSNTKYINNWDLVDLSAHEIVGRYLFARQPRISDDARLHFSKKQPLNSASLSKIRHPSEPKPNFSSSESGLPRSVHILDRLANSKSIWERRIAVLATFRFIKNSRFVDSLKIAEILLQDEHDLIHKAVGWMLREVGKKDLKTEIEFLEKYYTKMPRTMLRYAIEKFPEKLRKAYLKRTSL